MDLKRTVDIASGRKPADLVLKNGRIVNVFSCEVHEADVAIAGERIVGLGSYEGRETVDLKGQYVCPGFIDGHIHIESSLLCVPEFAKVVSRHGTAAVVADPHEIANVLGNEGIRYMLSSSKHCPIYVYMMASSCVPASRFESSGADLGAVDVHTLIDDRWVLGLAEMMDFKGVVAGDPECLAKLTITGDRPIDGHCPGLTGRDLCAYVAAGVGSDHECTALEEAREKLRLGMMVMIREGGQAKNLDALLPLVSDTTLDRFMFVTDDKDVEELLAEGHIDHLIRRAVAGGLNPIHAIKLVTLNPARYFRLKDLGAVAPGKLACLAIVDDLEQCRVRRVYQAGHVVAEDGVAIDPEADRRKRHILRSSVNVHWLEQEQFGIAAPREGECEVHVIEVTDGSLETKWSRERLPVRGGHLHADPQRGVCKVAVIERHQASGNIGLGFARGFGFTAGAIASSVCHDSHNVLIAGMSDHDMYTAAVQVVKMRGGFCVVRDGKVLASVPLAIAGLMSEADADTLSKQLHELHVAAQQLDSKLRRPFMALSFLNLSVIGALKITDQGLVDVNKFELIDVIAS